MTALLEDSLQHAGTQLRPAFEMGSAFVYSLSPCTSVACHALPATGENPVHKSLGGGPTLTWDLNFIVSDNSEFCLSFF